MTDLQTELYQSARGSIMALDSAADILPRNRGRDVLVTASYIGVLPARLVHDHLPRADRWSSVCRSVTLRIAILMRM